ncbi:glycosyltransferase family 1 protein [Eubacterium sp. AM05-23]|uniref:glycosyltransferase family 4 protein n=1 Tax=Eubacterium TaxID=1730 RepID=UPI000E4C690C|nr:MULTISPECIES: glycosyltransferase family 4 protein [Eubacterium]RHO55566.1 glycosyltransferase family 1 protein [Eubacterium sp. AM05-23]
MKKYIIYSALYYPNLGGVENYTYHLSKELLKMGHRVTLVTSNVFNLPTNEVIDGLEIYRLPCFNLLDGRFPVLKYNKICKQITKKLLQEKFDLAIINTRFYIHSLYAAKISRKSNTKSIVIEHGATHFSISSPFWDRVGHIYEHIETNILKFLCKNYYGVSIKSCEWIKHFGIVPKGILYDAVDFKYIEECLKKTNNQVDYREKLDLKCDDHIIAFVGRLITQKGIIQLVEAAKIIQDKYPNWKIVIAGDGPLMSTLIEKQSKNTLLLGKIEHKDVISLLNQSDIFCLPSDEEGFCLAAVEAIATKTYIVSTNVGIISEIVNNDQFGTIIPTNSTDEIIKGLEGAICNNNREKVIENAYKRLISMGLSWEELAKKIEKIV